MSRPVSYTHLYVVIKFARWAFEKFKGAEDKLGTQMRAVGEVMSIGKTFKEAYLKAIRSLEMCIRDRSIRGSENPPTWPDATQT